MEPANTGGTGGAAPAEDTQLKRSISTPLLFFFVVGDVLGSGIYALIGTIAGGVGGAIWVSFAIAVLFAFLTGFSYAELVTKYPRSAGASLYVNRAFRNRFLTFLVTFCVVASGLSAVGALAQVFGARYFQQFINLSNYLPTGMNPVLVVATAFIIVLALINFRGITESVRVNTAMSLVELSGLVIVLLVGASVILGGDANFSRPFQFNASDSWGPLGAALAGTTLAFFALIGFENAVNVAEETKDPVKTFPIALFGGIGLASLLYLAVAFTASLVLPTERLAGNTAALLDVAQAGPIPVPGKLFAAIALLAVTNTALVTLVMASRVIYGMANDGVIPRALGRVHRTRRTPWVAIIFTTTLALLLLYAVPDVGALADTTVLLIVIVFALVNASAIRLRNEPVDHAHYRAPMITPYLGIVACLILVAQIVRSDLANAEDNTVLTSAILIAIGVGMYVLNAVLQGRLDRSEGRLARGEDVRGA